MGVTGPRGFVASGIACGIKASGDPDLALVCTEDRTAHPAAGVFTSNKAKAAPVLTSRAHLDTSKGKAAAVILSSGNANAQTGKAGLSATELMCDRMASHIGTTPEEILVCQTGLIGVPFPIDRIETGIPRLVDGLGSDYAAGLGAATAIMTTDTVAKEVLIDGTGWSVGGMAKGAAMLSPNMATMLAVLTTDAPAEPELLARVLKSAVNQTFNEMMVDGCCSTNDTVILLSSGFGATASEADLHEAVTNACDQLSEQMVADAEGGTKVARIVVNGASSDSDALKAARKVAGSILVKCSINGADPYWGRVVSELGSAEVDFDPDRVAVSYGGVTVCDRGIAVGHDAGAVALHMAGDRILIECELSQGNGSASVITCDLSHGYIDENRGTS